MGENAKRAALASAFIYPGAGLFLLKHYVRGCIFAIPATLIVGAMMLNLMQVTLALNEEIQNELLTPQLISHLWTSLRNAAYESAYWQDGKWILLASWLLSILSSYSAGKKRDAIATETKSTHQP